MKRKKKIFTKKRIINRKRFILSLPFIIGIIFILSRSVKAILYKDILGKEKKNVVSAIKTPTSYIKDEELTIKKRIENIEESRNREVYKEQIKQCIENKKLKKTEEKENVPIKKENTKAEKVRISKEQKEHKKPKTSSYKSIFKDDLFVGDSLTDSLSFYEILEEKNVVAKLGLTVIGGKEKLDNITKANPSNIYLMFGVNDILREIDGRQFSNEYADLIYGIRAKLPNANIYVQSIPPVSPNVKKKKPLLSNENIDKFNEVLITMCKEVNVNFLDLRPIFNGNENLIEPDGIHLKYNFYKLWLDYIIDNIK